MDEEKTQKQGRGHHLKKGEVKKLIIEFILDNHGSDRYGNVLEPHIRKSLRNSNIVYDQANINRHLNELYKWGCVEKTESKIPRHPNKWKVKSIKNLRRIKKYLPDIRLNNYRKAIDIVFKEYGYDINSLSGFRIYLYLILSSSYFNTYVEFGIENLKSKAWKIYLDVEGCELNRLVTKYLHYTFEMFELIFNYGMSYETFLEKMKEIIPKTIVYLSFSKFCQLFNEKFAKLIHAKSNEEDESIYYLIGDLIIGTDDDLLEYLYYSIYDCFLSIWVQQIEFQAFCARVLFEDFYHQDIIFESVTSEEEMFREKTKENIYSYLSSNVPINDKKNELIMNDLNLASEIMMQKKMPLIFDIKLYENSKDLYGALIENFKFYLSEIPESILEEKQYESDNTPEAIRRFEEIFKNTASSSDNPKNGYNILSDAILGSYYYDINFKN